MESTPHSPIVALISLLSRRLLNFYTGDYDKAFLALFSSNLIRTLSLLDNDKETMQIIRIMLPLLEKLKISHKIEPKGGSSDLSTLKRYN